VQPRQTEKKRSLRVLAANTGFALDDALNLLNLS